MKCEHTIKFDSESDNDTLHYLLITDYDFRLVLTSLKHHSLSLNAKITELVKELEITSKLQIDIDNLIKNLER